MLHSGWGWGPHLDLSRAPYIVYGVKYIDPVSLGAGAGVGQVLGVRHAAVRARGALPVQQRHHEPLVCAPPRPCTKPFPPAISPLPTTLTVIMGGFISHVVPSIKTPYNIGKVVKIDEVVLK